jgi:hypothetical protein
MVFVHKAVKSLGVVAGIVLVVWWLASCGVRVERDATKIVPQCADATVTAWKVAAAQRGLPASALSDPTLRSTMADEVKSCGEKQGLKCMALRFDYITCQGDHTERNPKAAEIFEALSAAAA